MKIAIFGAGAMGTSLGALFARHGIVCDLVSRNEKHVLTLREKGACISGTENFCVPVTAIFPEEMLGLYDVIFLTAVQKDNDEIANFLKDYLTVDGVVVSTQNGFPEHKLAQILGKDRIYGCALSWGAERVNAGCVKITSENGYHFSLGAYGKDDCITELSALLQAVGEVITGNLCELRYAKLATNASFSTLSAISGLNFGQISKKYKRQALSLMREVFAVAKADGCKTLPLNGHDLLRVFGGWYGRFFLPYAMKKYSNTQSGMLKALQEGRRCEVDFVAGVVVERGKALGVATPYMQRAVSLVHEIENGLAEIAPESVALLDE